MIISYRPRALRRPRRRHRLSEAAGDETGDGRPGRVSLNVARAALASVRHDDRVSLVDHLGELRARLMLSGAALVAAFGLAFWQNHTLLNVLNRPLARATAGTLQHSRGPLAQSAREQQSVRVALERQRTAFELLARSPTPLDSSERVAVASAARADAAS